jgi:hypothetical protein
MSTKIAIRPWVPSSVAHEICSPIFPDSPLKSDQTDFTYSTTNDYGKKINKLLFCKPREGFSSDFFENIKEIGAIEGFEVIASETVHSVRDPKLRASDNNILEPSCISTLEAAIDRCYKRALHLKIHAACLSENPSVKNMGIGVVAREKMHRRTHEGIGEKKQRESRLYFEGGDSLHLTNKSNATRYLFGEDLSIVTHQALRKIKWFDPPPEERNTEVYYNEIWIYQKYNDQITPDYLSGKIANKIVESGLEFSKQIPDNQILGVLEEMHQMGLLTRIKFSSLEDKKKGREFATEYLAQLNFVVKELFPAELRCREDEVLFLPQIAGHLDMAMAPGPKGSIFLQDHNLSVRLLESIAANAEKFGLSFEDLEHLRSFTETTISLGKELKPLYEETKNRLQEAGYHVIPMPGAFYSYHNSNPFNVNFLNCVTGYSEKTGRFYLIAPGTKTDGKVGEALMDCYVEALRSHCNEIAVYFVGRSPADEKDFTEAVYTTNRQNSQLGPHCLSFELKIAPHTTKTT